MRNWFILAILLFFIIPTALAEDLKVNYVELPKEINPNTNYEIYINLESIDWNGTTIVTISAKKTSFMSSSQNVMLSGEERVKTYMLVKNETGYDTINIKLCKINQFGDAPCITKEFPYVIEEKKKETINSVYIILAIVVGLAILGFILRKNKN